MQNNKNINEKRQKHYVRMKGFLKYDTEERDVEEQRVILEEVIKVANSMLKELENK